MIHTYTIENFKYTYLGVNCWLTYKKKVQDKESLLFLRISAKKSAFTLRFCYSVECSSNKSNDHGYFNQERAEVKNSDLHHAFLYTFSSILSWIISSKTYNLWCSNKIHTLLWASSKSPPDDEILICSTHVNLYLLKNLILNYYHNLMIK